MDESGIVMSPLCRAIAHDGYSVYVRIYRYDSGGWILEVADAFGNFTGWIEPFESDQKALDEFNRTLLEEGIDSLVGPVSSFA